MVSLPEHPAATSGGWVCEHRLVMERAMNRLLTCGEEVHHINGNKKDNTLLNLVVCSRDEHLLAHRGAA